MAACGEAMNDENNGGQQGTRLCAFHGNRPKRVVSGEFAVPHSRPWTVMLKIGRFMCGASLINRPPNHEADLTEGSSDILLTAAHCFLECQPRQVQWIQVKIRSSIKLGQVDPNAVLSVLNLSQLTAVYDVYVLKVNSWNETIVPTAFPLIMPLHL
uniref:Peptidase S1 domain-containing protein n=1 Tax=Romanomermis culicivorax TaxID=13658 RepID=A0A915L2J2_ROMCU